jgi:arginyl-tRNA synthetase
VTPAGLADAVLSTARSVLAARGLDLSALPATTRLRRPHDIAQGDYSSALALQVAGRVGLAPRELAAAMADGLARTPGVRTVEVAGPGFLNIRVEPAAADRLAAEIVRSGRAYGAAGVGLRIEKPRGDADVLHFARIHSPGEPDVERWTRHHPDNPAYRVLYAHAHAATALRRAEGGTGDQTGGTADQTGGTADQTGGTADQTAGADSALVRTEPERALLDALGEFPDVVAEAARRHEPRRIARYLARLADSYDRFTEERPADDRRPARLRLTGATRVVLANGLDLLGITPPERM